MQQPQPVISPEQQQANTMMALANLGRAVKGGANNFYWIAGLSVVNSLISIFNGGVTFVVGLGLTQIVDALAFVLARDVPNGAIIFKVIDLVLSVVISGVFALFGLFAGKAHRWAFITGMVLYALDGLILLAFKDWLGFFFHLYFLWGIWSGLQALNKLKQVMPASQAVSDFPANIGS